jgi:hypothetical protein
MNKELCTSFPQSALTSAALWNHSEGTWSCLCHGSTSRGVYSAARRTVTSHQSARLDPFQDAGVSQEEFAFRASMRSSEMSGLRVCDFRTILPRPHLRVRAETAKLGRLREGRPPLPASYPSNVPRTCDPLRQTSEANARPGEQTRPNAKKAHDRQNDECKNDGTFASRRSLLRRIRYRFTRES